jgi:threonine dehydrogenase-like Zn-dependent dehydrogenase
MKRQSAIITGSGEVEMRELEMPELLENEVRIKVYSSLISPGSEMNLVKSLRENNNSDFEFRTFGYANAGEVLEVKGNCKNIVPGMRVAAMGAGKAEHANYANVPVNMVMPIPDAVSYDQAAYACLAATALQAVRRTEPTLGEFGVVLGTGIVGNLAAQFAKECGARVQCWEGINSRIDIAKQCGLDDVINFRDMDAEKLATEFATPYGLDFAIFAFGGDADPAFKSIYPCMKRSADRHAMGRITLVGGCQLTFRGGASSGNLNILSSARTGPGYKDKAYEYGQDYPNGFVQFTTQRNLDEIIRLIAEKKLIVDPMTTHKVKLKDVGSIANTLINEPEKALGVILEMEH